MQINFAMWRTAIWQLIKMDDKKEWDALDVVSKWLIATRSAVTLVTVYSCVIAGILAARDGYFSWAPFLIVTLGLFLAHGANNLLNDYTDYSRGLDNGNYFRTQYGVHPLVQGFFTKAQQIRWFIVSGILATLAGVYALFHTNFNPVVIGLFAFGAVVLLAYTYPFKYWGLGEFAIFLIWGPIMIAGVYFVLSGIWNWNVVLAGVPFGLSVASINVAKHIDKHDDDKAAGVGTFPVRVGEAAARRVDQIAIVMIYLP
jgi:1,4-dihydroxy-2-naphthoate polyprenyltransferase